MFRISDIQGDVFQMHRIRFKKTQIYTYSGVAKAGPGRARARPNHVRDWRYWISHTISTNYNI